MKKVYQIIEILDNELHYGEVAAEYPIGFFTDKEEAENIFKKLNTDLESNINRVREEILLEKLVKPTEQDSGFMYTNKYVALQNDLYEYERTSYDMREYELNKLYR